MLPDGLPGIVPGAVRGDSGVVPGVPRGMLPGAVADVPGEPPGMAGVRNLPPGAEELPSGEEAVFEETPEALFCLCLPIC